MGMAGILKNIAKKCKKRLDFGVYSLYIKV